MRILFTTRGSAGHAGPLAPFAHAALRAGHEVLVACQPQHVHHVERLGLPVALLDDPPHGAWTPLMARLPSLTFDEANALVVGELFGRVDTEATLAPLEDLVDRWAPDVLVRETWEFASVLAAQRRGLPVARVALGLGELDDLTARLVAPALDAIRGRAGLPADPAGSLLQAAPQLTMLPAALDPGSPAGTTSRFRHERPAARLVRGWWPGDERPLVYATFGSVAATGNLPYWPQLYRDASDALADLPARVLLTLGADLDRRELGPVPANVHVEPWVPQDAVLAEAAVVVGHGGHGTTLGALAHGVPQVVLPLFSIDQWMNAAAVDRVGAGVAVGAWPEDLLALSRAADLQEAARIAGALLDAGGGAQGRAARRIAAEIAEQQPVDAAIDVLAAAAGPPSRHVPAGRPLSVP